ncbi:hypothetical protein Q1695_005214 [Nippostrongylus brasiliensis]|nr:hypothetical protein Q1695_005214 [Nippostrongylus brasiliensis]
MRAVLLALCVVALASPWVIYRRNHKKKLVCKEDASGNSTSMEETSAEESTPLTRRKRDIERKNKTSKVVDDDFDLISDELTPAEIEEVKQQIRETCNALRPI